jgi:hypothetical protein
MINHKALFHKLILVIFKMYIFRKQSRVQVVTCLPLGFEFAKNVGNLTRT